jgi:DNA-binding HxlR family transcriptional regulator
MALELVGERWALLTLRELMFGPRRFGELRAHLTGISAKVLTQRLGGLEAAGLVVRVGLPPPASVQAYDLTDWGREVEPILQTMGRWATRAPQHDPTLPLSPASAMLSLRTMIDAEKAQGLRLTIGFDMGDDRFRATLDEGRLEIVRGDPAGADVIVTAMPTPLAVWIYVKRPLAEAEADGSIRIAGDRAKALAFADLFALPEKAAIGTAIA